MKMKTSAVSQFHAGDEICTQVAATHASQLLFLIT